MGQNNAKIKKLQTKDINDTETNKYFSILYSTLALLTNRINDLDKSLEFCKLNLIHSSVTLIQELQALSKLQRLKEDFKLNGNTQLTCQ